MYALCARCAILTLWIAFLTDTSKAQPLAADGQRDYTLSNGLTVRVLHALDDPSRYYYLPPTNGLRITKRPNGEPEFLFLKYSGEREGVEGGLLHFLVGWGLTQEEEKELESQLRSDAPGANLMGAAPLLPLDASFQIISGTLGSDAANSFVGGGRAPLLPGGRVAAASKLSVEGANLLAVTFDEGRLGDISVSMDVGYEVVTPAVRGEIIVDWTKVDSFSREYDSGAGAHSEVVGKILLWDDHEDQFTQTEVDSLVQALDDIGVVTLKIDNLTDASSEMSEMVTQAFMDYFTQTAFLPIASERVAPPDTPRRVDPTELESGETYTVSQQVAHQIKTRAYREYTIEQRLPIRLTHSVTVPLSRWGNLPIERVDTYDRFYDRSQVQFMVDLELPEQLFKTEINNVTVQIRRGNFEDHRTIHANYIAENGLLATFNTRPGLEDQGPYEYRTTWSLKRRGRSGGAWSPFKGWRKIDTPAPVLVPPVTPLKVAISSDPDWLSQNGVRQAVVQLRYRRLGEEVKEEVRLNVIGEDISPLIEHPIFVDRDQDELVYRVIFLKRGHPLMALPWREIEYGIVDVAIPEELINAEPESETVRAANERVEAEDTDQLNAYFN